MTYIVHGATGAQGSPVYNALAAAGKTPLAAVRNPESLPEGLRGIRVDLTDAATLIDAYTDVDGVFLHLPVTTPEQSRQQASAISSAIRQARPPRIVISTGGSIIDQPGSPVQVPENAPLNHILETIESEGISHAVLVPRLFLENLLTPEIVNPKPDEEIVLRYPLPANYPVSWVSHLDVADAVVRLLGDHSVKGMISLGYSPGITGVELAVEFSKVLERPVRFESLAPEAMPDYMGAVCGPGTTTSLVEHYRTLNTQSGHTINASTSAEKLLGMHLREVNKWFADALS